MPTVERYLRLLLSIAILVAASCRAGGGKESPEKKEISAGTPVTVTAASTVALTEYIELNATATFLQKSYVKANVNGYIQTVTAVQGKHVSAGQTLFVLKTKEAQSIGNSLNELDPFF